MCDKFYIAWPRLTSNLQQNAAAFEYENKISQKTYCYALLINIPAIDPTAIQLSSLDRKTFRASTLK